MAVAWADDNRSGQDKNSRYPVSMLEEFGPSLYSADGPAVSFFGFPDEYLKRIGSIWTLCDPNPDRRVKEWETVKMVRAGS